jgi:hypothetical protein
MAARIVRACSACALSLLLATGCGPVRENRSINWSPDGKSVAVAHGNEGVFIADRGGELRKIFQPDSNAVATSAPLWSPTGKRLLFAVARPASDQAKARLNRTTTDPPPDGRIVFAEPTAYTCYLWHEPEDGAERKPEALFTATCDHPGYVAANLALRWSPDGRHILFVNETSPGAHSLFEFDPETKRSRRILPHAAPALVFDYSPDGRFLGCVLGGKDESHADAGIWVARTGETSWWHVPQSTSLGVGEFGWALDRLQASRPVWPRDSSRFAFVTSRRTTGKEPRPAHTLYLANVPERTVGELDAGDEPYRDLAWSPNGERLGLVRGEEVGSLHVFWPEEGLGTSLVEGRVRRFAGWDQTGGRLAFVALAASPDAGTTPYNWLLPRDPLARDALFIAADGETPPQQPVLTGARFTFLQWSPTEPVLSLWITFTPTHRSWYSLYRDTGLRPGDPAAVYDPRTGIVDWKPINAHERTQVGHFYLTAGDNAEAWRWYEKAEAGTAELTPDQRLEAILAGRDATLFHYVCLSRLGMQSAAAEKLRVYENAFRPRPIMPPLGGQVPIALPVHRYRHLRDRYAAEVFLSLGAVTDGEKFFRADLGDAGGDEERLSSALVLSQFLLVRGDYEAYADLIADTVLPLLPRCHGVAGSGAVVDALEQADYQAVLPVASPNLLAMLPCDQVERLLSQLERLADKARGGEQRLALDMILAATYRYLGQTQDADAAVRRVLVHPEWQQNRRWWTPAGAGETDAGLAGF